MLKHIIIMILASAGVSYTMMVLSDQHYHDAALTVILLTAILLTAIPVISSAIISVAIRVVMKHRMQFELFLLWALWLIVAAINIANNFSR